MGLSPHEPLILTFCSIIQRGRYLQLVIEQLWLDTDGLFGGEKEPINVVQLKSYFTHINKKVR